MTPRAPGLPRSRRKDLLGTHQRTMGIEDRHHADAHGQGSGSGKYQAGCKHFRGSGYVPAGWVAITGQTLCYDSLGDDVSCAGTGQDGQLRPGVAWPNPRFTDNNNGTVTDNLTGLMWLKDANCFGLRTWAQALSDAQYPGSPDTAV